MAFYTKQANPAFSFPQPTLSTVKCSRGYSIYFSLWSVIQNRLAATKRAWIRGPWNWGKKGDICIYKHIYIWRSQMRLTSGTGNPGRSTTWPELVCEAWRLPSKKKLLTYQWLRGWNIRQHIWAFYLWWNLRFLLKFLWIEENKLRMNLFIDCAPILISALIGQFKWTVCIMPTCK